MSVGWKPGKKDLFTALSKLLRVENKQPTNKGFTVLRFITGSETGFGAVVCGLVWGIGRFAAAWVHVRAARLGDG